MKTRCQPMCDTRHCDTEHTDACALCGEEVRVPIGDGLYLKGTDQPLCCDCCSGGFIHVFTEDEKRRRQELSEQCLEKARRLFESEPSLNGVEFDGGHMFLRDEKGEIWEREFGNDPFNL